jgi:lipid II:glycine glycyltransferase (peptidoglycan interpeptide bridge formation enzyme)
MEFRVLASLTDEERAQWDRFVVESPFGHSFQSLAWGEFQKIYSHRDCLYLIGTRQGRWQAVALIFRRQWPKPFSRYCNYEISCGPVYREKEDLDEIVRFLDQWAAPRAVFLQIGPRWPLKYYAQMTGLPQSLGFEPSSDPNAAIYAEETVLVDLRPSDEEILMSFRYTTRYEIRKAERAGVRVRFSNDPQAMKDFYDLHLQQSTRLGVAPESRPFFMLMQEHVLSDPAHGCIAIADYEGQPLSAAIYFRFASLCRFHFGASNEHLRRKLDTSHLLHWRAMQHFKQEGCDSYDLCGASPSLPRNYPTYGINIFKTGFSKHFERFTPDFIKTYHPVLASAFMCRSRLYGVWREAAGRIRVVFIRLFGRKS